MALALASPFYTYSQHCIQNQWNCANQLQHPEEIPLLGLAPEEAAGLSCEILEEETSCCYLTQHNFRESGILINIRSCELLKKQHLYFQIPVIIFWFLSEIVLTAEPVILVLMLLEGKILNTLFNFQGVKILMEIIYFTDFICLGTADI